MPDEQTTLRLCTSWCHWTAELVKESQVLPYERNSRWRLPWRIHRRGFPFLYDICRVFPGNYGDGIVDHNTGSGKTLRMIQVCDNYFHEARAIRSLLRMLTGKWCPRHAASKLMLQESFAQGSIEVLEAQNDPKVAKATATTSGTSSNWTACGYLRALWTFASIPIVLVLVLVGYTKDTTARSDVNNVPICNWLMNPDLWFIAGANSPYPFRIYEWTKMEGQMWTWLNDIHCWCNSPTYTYP